MEGPRVLVLGVGNTLMRDDGVGVWAVNTLADTYCVPASVRIVDGGVAGLRLLSEIADVDYLLIVDAVRRGGDPGTIYRLDPGGVSARQGPFFSAHEVGIAELLSTASFCGRLPKTQIIGVEPLETESVGIELTDALRGSLPRVVAAVVEELGKMGLELREKQDLPAP
jgi:hydrogenase maturation protease